MKADEKEVKRKRLEISLNLENKEDREVWNILKKKKNILFPQRENMYLD